MSYQKYVAPQTVEIADRVWPTRRIVNAPQMVPVDLRDGNQAFVNPMNVEQKIRYFEMLCNIGFKEIEVAYPSASSEEFNFVRRLITENRIPDDVRICVFTAARPDLIARTFDAIAGVKQAVVHCYIAASELHRVFVFDKTHAELIETAVAGTRLIAQTAAERGMRDLIHYEFSPEEFSDADTDFIVELAHRVYEAWQPTRPGEFILNLPSTVERRAPNEYADKIEYFCRRYRYLDNTVISVHTHNDQGCGIAAAELAVLAGAVRIEGTLAGHGERTGNMDLIAFALNLKSRGVAVDLDFSDLPQITAFIEEQSGIATNPRAPYAGELVFTAFSGTHQDAIRKAMARRDEIADYFKQGWKIPYLHLDPADIGRSYEGLIRINSQSGKGGVAYVLESMYGIKVPKAMQPMVARAVQQAAEASGKEVSFADVLRIFEDGIVNVKAARIEIKDFRMNRPDPATGRGAHVDLDLVVDGQICQVAGSGSGPVEAAANALRRLDGFAQIEVADYHEHALTRGAGASAIAYIGIALNGQTTYGAGIDPSINFAAVRALVNAVNHALKNQSV